MSSSTISRPTSVQTNVQVIDFKPPRRSFVLHNAKRREVIVPFWGNRIAIPPVYEVGPYSDVDADGDPIPGSRVIQDVVGEGFDEKGEEFLVIDAAKCVIHVLGLKPGADGKGSEATSPYAIEGLSLLPIHAPKMLWKEIAESGQHRSFLAEVEHARVFMKQIDESNAKRKAAGMPATDDYDVGEYERYRMILDQHRELVKANVQAMVAPHEADAEDEELEMETHVRAVATRLSEKFASEQGLSTEGKLELLRQLLSDPKVRSKAQREYQIRKRGNRPVSSKELEDAIVEGKPAPDHVE